MLNDIQFVSTGSYAQSIIFDLPISGSQGNPTIIEPQTAYYFLKIYDEQIYIF